MMTRNPRMQARGREIFGGPSKFDAKVGEVTVRAPGFPAEEVAMIWAWAMDPMFPTLAELRNTLREIARRKDCPESIAELLRDLSDKAHAALPTPAIGDAKAAPPPPEHPTRPAHYLSSVFFLGERCSHCIHSRVSFDAPPCADCARTCAAFGGLKPAFVRTEGGAR